MTCLPTIGDDRLRVPAPNALGGPTYENRRCRRRDPIYAADHRDGSLFSIGADGEVTKLLQFPLPTSHVVYHDDSLFITSRGAYVVLRYDLTSGVTEIIAGDGEPGDRDGRGIESSFGSPNASRSGPTARST